MNQEIIKTTDNNSILYKDGKLYKVRRHRATSLLYEEVDPKEYDKRIQALAEKIASCPRVNLLDTLKDALYDVSLDFLDRIEKKVNKELVTAEAMKVEPRIRTKTAERGTCVDLFVGKRLVCNIRE